MADYFLPRLGRAVRDARPTVPAGICAASRFFPPLIDAPFGPDRLPFTAGDSGLMPARLMFLFIAPAGTGRGCPFTSSLRGDREGGLSSRQCAGDAFQYCLLDDFIDWQISAL